MRNLRLVLRDAWDRNAKEWIAWAQAPGFDHYWRFHRDTFFSLMPPPGRLTLDVGCGEGRVGRDLVRLGHRVVQIDSSLTMIRAAKAHPDAGGHCVLGDAADLPFSDSTADCVISFMSLQDVDQMEAAIDECARVLFTTVTSFWLSLIPLIRLASLLQEKKRSNVRSSYPGHGLTAGFSQEARTMMDTR